MKNGYSFLYVFNSWMFYNKELSPVNSLFNICRVVVRDLSNSIEDIVMDIYAFRQNTKHNDNNALLANIVNNTMITGLSSLNTRYMDNILTCASSPLSTDNTESVLGVGRCHQTLPFVRPTHVLFKANPSVLLLGRICFMAKVITPRVMGLIVSMPMPLRHVMPCHNHSRMGFKPSYNIIDKCAFVKYYFK